MTLEVLGKFVRSELAIKLSDPSAKSRMQKLFVAYHGMRRRHGLSCIVKSNPKLSISHVTSAIKKPQLLRTRLKSDLELSQSNLKKDCM